MLSINLFSHLQTLLCFLQHWKHLSCRSPELECKTYLSSKRLLLLWFPASFQLFWIIISIINPITEILLSIVWTVLTGLLQSESKHSLCCKIRQSCSVLRGIEQFAATFGTSNGAFLLLKYPKLWNWSANSGDWCEWKYSGTQFGALGTVHQPIPSGGCSNRFHSRNNWSNLIIVCNSLF
jgi:hypothetical protein